MESLFTRKEKKGIDQEIIFYKLKKVILDASLRSYARVV